MIDKTAIIPTVLERLKKIENGHYLDIRTYKRNRSVRIIKYGDDLFKVMEDGYEQEVFDTDFSKLKKLLKTLLKKEFPRSTKIRLYAMGKYDPEKVKENLFKRI